MPKKSRNPKCTPWPVPHRRCLVLHALMAMGLMGALLVPPAGAQTADPDSLMTLDESLLFLDLSRVTAASRYEQDTREAPSSITVITAEEIRDFGYRSVADALAGVRGFWINNDRNYSYLGARGFSVPGDFNSRILLLVDGVRINDNVYESALFGTEEVIDVHLLERIEVIRGPGSSLYGTGAVFGVVNLVTRRGRWLDGGSAQASVGSWGTGQASLSWGRRTASGVEVLVGGSGYRSRGPALYFPEFDDPSTNDGVAEALDEDRYARGFAKVVYGGFSVESGVQSRRKTVPTGSYGTLFGNPENWTVDAALFGVLRYDRTLPGVARLSTSLSLHRYTFDGSYAYADGISRDDAEGRWVRGNVQYDRRVGQRHRLLLGVDVHRDLMAEQETRWDDEVILDTDAVGTLWGVYLQDEVTLRPDLRLGLGLRHDEYETFGGTTNPRGSLVWTPGDRWAVKLLYGTAFRAPNAYELYYQDNGASQKAAGSLDPERIRSVEGVVEHQVRPGLRTALSIFQTELDGLVGQVEDPDDGLLVFRNIDEARTSGFEMEADYRTSGGTRASAAYTFQSMKKNVEGAVFSNSPRHLVQGRISVPMARERVRASLSVRRISSQMTWLEVEAAPYTVADLTLLAWIRPERLRLEVNSRNLFDAAYGTPAGVDVDMPVVPQDRRSFSLGIRTSF